MSAQNLPGIIISHYFNKTIGLAGDNSLGKVCIIEFTGTDIISLFTGLAFCKPDAGYLGIAKSCSR
jgi:hypothetical protein